MRRAAGEGGGRRRPESGTTRTPPAQKGSLFVVPRRGCGAAAVTRRDLFARPRTCEVHGRVSRATLGLGLLCAVCLPVSRGPVRLWPQAPHGHTRDTRPYPRRSVRDTLYRRQRPRAVRDDGRPVRRRTRVESDDRAQTDDGHREGTGRTALSLRSLSVPMTVPHASPPVHQGHAPAWTSGDLLIVEGRE